MRTFEVRDGACDAFTERVAETTRAMTVAGGFDPGEVVGPAQLVLDRRQPVGFDNPFEDGETLPRQRGEP
jgi:hypothetical protein